MSVDVDVFIYFFANTTFSSVKHSMKEKEKYFLRFIQFNVKTKHYESLKVRLKEIALGGDGMARPETPISTSAALGEWRKP